MILPCAWETQVIEAVAVHGWPARAEESLRRHVAECASCSEVASIARALLDEHDTAYREAAVPAASAVWWRAQIRAREEAARAATRPLLAIQAAATIVAAGIAILLAPAASAWIQRGLAALGAVQPPAVPADLTVAWVLSAAAYTSLPLLVAAVWVVLAPVVVYLALDD